MVTQNTSEESELKSVWMDSEKITENHWKLSTSSKTLSSWSI